MSIEALNKSKTKTKSIIFNTHVNMVTEFNPNTPVKLLRLKSPKRELTPAKKGILNKKLHVSDNKIVSNAKKLSKLTRINTRTNTKISHSYINKAEKKSRSPSPSPAKEIIFEKRNTRHNASKK